MYNRYSDFEELRPIGEGSHIPDEKLNEGCDGDPRRQRVATSTGGYPDEPTDTGGTCRSCGASVPDGQTKCRFCLTNHLGGMATATTDTGQEPTLVGIVFTLVESSTFYGAVAKSAAAGNLLVGSETAEAVEEHRLIYDLEEEPAPQLVDRWPSLPDATTVTLAAGEQLLTAIRERMGGQGGATLAGAYEAKARLYDESGDALSAESCLDTMLENADDPLWLVPGIDLKESSEDRDRGDQSPGIPTREQLECHHCGGETDHRFHTHESLPDDTWSGQPIWECRECGACRYGPNPSTRCPP
ncbi:hypothetical protein [Halomicrococcus sp. NG-SE-24]|uniref:biosurfactant protein 1 n=1 Tax=Halomicrococcus sp. NG-SE-24 TaxID=3436928 RepID=UPI003D9622D3